MPLACKYMPFAYVLARGGVYLHRVGGQEISQETPKTLVRRQDFNPCGGGKSAPLTTMAAPMRPLEAIDRVDSIPRCSAEVG